MSFRPQNTLPPAVRRWAIQTEKRIWSFIYSFLRVFPPLKYSAPKSLRGSLSRFRSQPNGHLLREATLTALPDGAPLRPSCPEAVTSWRFISPSHFPVTEAPSRLSVCLLVRGPPCLQGIKSLRGEILPSCSLFCPPVPGTVPGPWWPLIHPPFAKSPPPPPPSRQTGAGAQPWPECRPQGSLENGGRGCVLPMHF